MNDKPTENVVNDLPVITKFIYSIGVLPTSYKMSMTYEEQVVWLCNYLETTVIPAVNQNGEAVEELQNLYELLRTYVNDYFDNLDVQEEINNKLDEMTESGELTEIIKNYVDPLYIGYQQEINSEINTFRESVTYSLDMLDTKIDSAASGSPRGVYATVAALTSADPDHSYTYLVTADGKWYYYNDGWTEGGTYQGTGIANNSVTMEKLSPEVQKELKSYGNNLLKDPIDANNQLTWSKGNGSNYTLSVTDVPEAMTGATNTKALRLQTTASGGYIQLSNFLKPLHTTVTKVSLSLYLYTAAYNFKVLAYNGGSLIKSSATTSGLGYKIMLEDIEIDNISNLRLAFQGTGGLADVYVTDITLVEGNVASPYYIPYDYVEVKQSVIRNKNILIFGDSITDCCNITIDSSNQTSSYTWKNPSNSYVDSQSQLIQYSMWPKIINDNYGCKEIRNYAKSGAHWRTDGNATGDNARQNLDYQITVAINDRNNPNNVFNQSSFTPDIIIFALGTNDTSNDTYEDAMNKSVYSAGTTNIDVSATLSNLNLTKFNESVRHAFLRVKQQWPMAQIYVVLPIQRASKEVTVVNSQLEEMGLRYGALIINGAGNSGITREFNINDGLGTYLKDGLHPNEKGQNLLTRLILTSVLANYMDFELMN